MTLLINLDIKKQKTMNYWKNTYKFAEVKSTIIWTSQFYTACITEMTNLKKFM